MKKISLNDHENYLKKNIFFTENKWPHFELIFSDIKKFSKTIKNNSTVVSLERNNLYGGVSLFAPYFSKSNFISVDCSMPRIRKRGNYNNIENKSLIIEKKNNYIFNFDKIKLNKNLADLILVPNLMNHIPDIEIFFHQIKKILKKNGKLYIFEPLIRELHQEPDDYFRITPYGFKHILKDFGFTNFKTRFNGGPFTAVGYCWDQAIQYLPKSKKNKVKKWLEIEMKKLILMDKKYKKNNFRKNTSFPMSFSLTTQLTKK
mgnify:CR=1 FL=1